MKAIVLAAGFATRLYPLTKDLAKPLLEVGGRPVLSWVLDKVLTIDAVDEVVVVSNHRFHHQFVAWREGYAARVPLRILDDGSTDDTNKLGAIGDLALALEEPLDEHELLVCAGDNLFEFELTSAHARFSSGDQPLLLLRTLEGEVPPGRYSDVMLDEQGSVQSFREKPADPQSKLCSMCLYFFPPGLRARVQRYMDASGNPDAPGYFLEWLSHQEPLTGMVGEGRCFDIGNKRTLELARAAYSAVPAPEQRSTER